MSQKSKAELVKLINDVIDEKRSASYAGGTLCIPDDESKHGLLFLNVSEDNQADEVLYALAKCYIKYRSKANCFWDLSHEIVARIEKEKKICA